MKPDSRFWKILFWETLENWPPIVSIVIAIRVQADSWLWALACVFTGTTLGAISIHFTEIKKYSNQPTLKETTVNFVVFTVLAVLFLFYYSQGEVWWSNWITDVVVGAAVGVALTLGESLGWSSTATVKTHALAMAIASALILIAIRLLHNLEPLALVVLAATLVTVAISLIIVWIDYWPIKSLAAVNSHSRLEK